MILLLIFVASELYQKIQGLWQKIDPQIFHFPVS